MNLPSSTHYDKLIARAQTLSAAPCAIAHPCDEPSLSAALEARDLGLLHPILVGPERKIRDTAAQFRLNLGDARIVDAPHSHAAAETAVALVRAGEASLLMKGSLHTDELMHEVVARNTGLRSSRRISHVFIMEVPTYPEPLFITDAAINIFPDLETKADIIRNVIDLHHGLGLGEPRVAILSAVEQVTPSIPSTIEAAALCKMADRGQIAGGLLDGPLALDNAISPDAARIKGIRSHVAGVAQVLVVPDLRPATCWPRTSPSWPMPRPPASCWRARAHHPDQPRGQPALAPGLGGGGGDLLVPPGPATGPPAGLRPAGSGFIPRPPQRISHSMSDTILVINAGSSSIKFYLYDIDGKEELAPRLGGQLEGIGTTHPRLRVRDAAGQTLVERDIAPATRPMCPMARKSWAPGSAATSAARRWPWAIAWCTAALSCPEPVLIDDDILARLDAYTRWRRCTSPTTWRPSA